MNHLAVHLKLPQHCKSNILQSKQNETKKNIAKIDIKTTKMKILISSTYLPHRDQRIYCQVLYCGWVARGGLVTQDLTRWRLGTETGHGDRLSVLQPPLGGKELQPIPPHPPTFIRTLHPV